jgi:signal recognition particle receptor subunit beta
MVNDNPPSRMTEFKVVVTGTMGAGKTTAIRSISDKTTLSTEVPISEPVEGDKTSTTVGMDYGECELDDQVVLKLFGTPGQERFRFMWDILGTGAFGLIVLADNSRPDPVADVAGFLQAFARHVPARRTVIGVGRLAQHPSPSIDEYCQRLQRLGFVLPVIEVDVRRANDVRLLLSVLVSMAEVEYE